MSKWAGKYVIGLTGNIGTGKSVVRKMLEHLGAYGIDADALAHRAIAKGAPGYQQVVQVFGQYVLSPNGEINRARLGRLVFSDPDALSQLEAIIHPLVRQALDFLIKRAAQPVVVIEAIKLLEASLGKQCDSIWVVYAPPETQINRLIQRRAMSESEARQRMDAQPPQEQKVAAANIVIRNAGSFEDTWKQVLAAWRKTVPAVEEPTAQPVEPTTFKGELHVVRGLPRHSHEIASLLNRLADGGQAHTSDEIMAAFGEKAFLMLKVDKNLQGVIGWQVENLVSRTTDIVVDPSLPILPALTALIKDMETSSQDLQCEASLIFVKPSLARFKGLWRELGYEAMKPEALEVQAWQDAARESTQPGTVLLFKKLRQDRILRPI